MQLLHIVLYHSYNYGMLPCLAEDSTTTLTTGINPIMLLLFPTCVGVYIIALSVFLQPTLPLTGMSWHWDYIGQLKPVVCGPEWDMPGHFHTMISQRNEEYCYAVIPAT